MAEQTLPTPQTREDMYNAFLSGDKTYTVETLPTPITRKEMYLASLCGMKDIQLPTPISREDTYLSFIIEKGGLGGSGGVTVGEWVPIETKTFECKTNETNVIASGEYTPPTEPTT